MIRLFIHASLLWKSFICCLCDSSSYLFWLLLTSGETCSLNNQWRTLEIGFTHFLLYKPVPHLLSPLGIVSNTVCSLLIYTKPSWVPEASHLFSQGWCLPWSVQVKPAVHTPCLHWHCCLQTCTHSGNQPVGGAEVWRSWIMPTGWLVAYRAALGTCLWSS